MSFLSLCRRSAICGLETLARPFISQCRFATIPSPGSVAPTIEPPERTTRRFGYQDKLTRRGLLAHNDAFDRVNTLRKYIPKDAWTRERALFGQNDYIDILGNGEVHPSTLLYKIPRWLRGFMGNEFQVLIRRRKFISKQGYSSKRPLKWHNLNKRIRYLYRFMNRKTRTPMVTRGKP